MHSSHVSPLKRLAAAATLVAFAATAMPAVSYAGMIGTAEAISAQASPARSANLERVTRALARDDVRAQLVRYGVDPAQASARVAALSDHELASLADRMDSLPAGGDGALAIIGIVFLVLLILDYTGVIHIFRR